MPAFSFTIVIYARIGLFIVRDQYCSISIDGYITADPPGAGKQRGPVQVCVFFLNILMFTYSIDKEDEEYPDRYIRSISLWVLKTILLPLMSLTSFSQIRKLL